MFIKLVIVFLLFAKAIFGQTPSSIKDPRKILEQTGISERQAKIILDDIINERKSAQTETYPNAQDSDESPELLLKKIYNEEQSLNELNDSDDEKNTDFFLDEQDLEGDIDSNVEISEGPVLDKGSSGFVNFGYNLFLNNPEVFQQSVNESVDPNYLVNPGDEIIVMLWGDTELNRNFTISRDGYIFIPNIGQVFVNGLTVEKIEDKLRKLLKKVYSTLGSSTFFDISLGAQALRPLRIIALGEIAQPGAYNVSHSTTLFSSLFYFNGPTLNGSLRNISLVRNGENIKNIDYYSYLLKGVRENDVQLQRDDVVFIPRRGKSVTVLGEINRPGKYELKDGEKLVDLLEFSGGLISTTYLNRVKIERILPAELRSTEGIDRTIVDIDLSGAENLNQIELFDGDILTFFEISEAVQNIVLVEGAIRRPGQYELKEGMKISELISISGGLLSDTYLDRVEIERVNSDYTTSLISLNADSIFDDKRSDDILLNSNDKIKFFNKNDLIHSDDVSISGHVINPGRKEFFNEMTLFDLIFSGGGFDNEIHLSKTYFERGDLIRLNEDSKTSKIITFRVDSVLAGKGKSRLKLEMGDEVKIYSLSDVKGLNQNLVNVVGYVKRPGKYPLYSGLNLYELLFLSGGIDDVLWSEKLYKDRIDVIRLDTKSNKKKIIQRDIGSIIKNSKNNEVNIDLIDGDLIRVYSSDLINMSNAVQIEGIIKNPGIYDLKSDMSVKDLILEAGGVLSDIHEFRVDVSSVSTENDLEKYSIVKTINMNNDISIFKNKNSDTKNSKNIMLKPYDIVTLRPDPKTKFQRKVNISGFVHYPGDYVIEYSNEKVTSIIERAGGLLPDAYPAASRFVRNGKSLKLSFEKLIKRPKSRYNFSVTEGDSIYIGSKTNIVVVNGEVNVSGIYQYMPNKTLKDYIEMSGGFTKSAHRSQVYVTYPNGISRKSSLLKDPKVFDGSVIIVPLKPEKDFSFTEYATSLTSIWADFTQAYLMILLAARGS